LAFDNSPTHFESAFQRKPLKEISGAQIMIDRTNPIIPDPGLMGYGNILCRVLLYSTTPPIHAFPG
jgi:hypothetical protein